MDSRVKLYLQMAENKIILAKINLEISLDKKTKNILRIPLEKTFFNDVISDCYYAIFYSAKAYLISLGIETHSPEEHKKSYEQFERIVNSGRLDKELLEIYESESEKAEFLLNIFHLEKKKRGRFTYNINANANIPFAKESLNNAIKFVSLINNLLESYSKKEEEKTVEKIMSVIKENREITIEEIAKKLNLPTREVDKDIARLKSEGLLIRVGPDKGGYWKIVKKEDVR